MTLEEIRKCQKAILGNRSLFELVERDSSQADRIINLERCAQVAEMNNLIKLQMGIEQRLQSAATEISDFYDKNATMIPQAHHILSILRKHIPE